MTLPFWPKKCSKGMILFFDHLSQILSYFQFWPMSRIELSYGQTVARKDLNFIGRIRNFLRNAPMSTKKSYLVNLIFAGSAKFPPKRHGVATGISDKPFIGSTRFFFDAKENSCPSRLYIGLLGYLDFWNF